MSGFKVYQDLAERTNGEFYLGVCGPVRTGKSTFIKRFMELMVIPGIEDENEKERTTDELPQSADGKTIMTTEPKFIPKEAVSVDLYGENQVKVRMIDCVGYIVQEAEGIREEENERMVMTPWSKEPMPFSEAAEFGTRKVIHDHSTLGIVVTTDGSFGEISREAYIPAEERTIQELKSIGKPFVVLLNTVKPFGEETKELAQKLSEKYEVSVLPVNCNQLRNEDIGRIMEQMLSVFPIRQLVFRLPKWVEMLSREHKIKKDLLENVRALMQGMEDIRSALHVPELPESEYIEKAAVEKVAMDTGCVQVRIDFKEQYYYEVLSELTGAQIKGEYELIAAMKELSAMKAEYTQIKDAFADVKMKGYGVVSPKKEDITLDEPVIIKQGSKYGVKIRSEAPSIHMIRAVIETEIAPIVGNEKQAEDLVEYIKTESETPQGIWGTNIFGKSIEELVMDGMRNKITTINEESQVKLQDTMQKIVNDSKGGLVCIII